MFSSIDEHGKLSSNFEMTSGCSIPSLPTYLSLTRISAQRPGKYVGSENNEN
jgi:hypothetical protein